MSIRTQYATVGGCMTPSPRSIGQDQPVTKATEIMRNNGFRHLPVLDGGVCVGIVTDRDLSLAESLKDPEGLVVEDIMTPDPWVVGPETPLIEVARTMQERRYGAAVVMERSKVTGIFTTIDALRVLAELLEAPAEAPAKKSAARKPAVKKPAAAKTAAKKSTAAKATAAKATVKRAPAAKAAKAAPARVTPARKASPARKATAARAPAKKAPATKTSAIQAPARKASVRTPAKKSASTKAAAAKAPTTKASVKKTAARKAPVKKTTAGAKARRS